MVVLYKGCLNNNVHNLLYAPLWDIFSLPRLWVNVLLAKVNDSMKIRISTSLRVETVSNVQSKMVKSVAFRTGQHLRLWERTLKT